MIKKIRIAAHYQNKKILELVEKLSGEIEIEKSLFIRYENAARQLEEVKNEVEFYLKNV